MSAPWLIENSLLVKELRTEKKMLELELAEAVLRMEEIDRLRAALIQIEETDTKIQHGDHPVTWRGPCAVIARAALNG